MRTIRKGKECVELKAWKRLNRTSPQNLHYDYLDSATRSAMLQRLVMESGQLCAYTMKPIIMKDGRWQAHIEHVMPRTTHSDITITWTNLVACIPQPGAACDFGAVCKGAYDPDVRPFLSPIGQGVAGRFRFRDNGKVEGLDPAAVEVVKPTVLNLNHPELVNDREAKIREALRHAQTAKKARDRASALRMPDRNGVMEPYCEAVAQVLDEHARKLENRAGRLARTRRD